MLVLAACYKCKPWTLHVTSYSLGRGQEDTKRTSTDCARTTNAMQNNHIRSYKHSQWCMPSDFHWKVRQRFTIYTKAVQRKATHMYSLVVCACRRELAL